jgi:hypothetical protein
MGSLLSLFSVLPLWIIIHQTIFSEERRSVMTLLAPLVFVSIIIVLLFVVSKTYFIARLGEGVVRLIGLGSAVRIHLNEVTGIEPLRFDPLPLSVAAFRAERELRIALRDGRSVIVRNAGVGFKQKIIDHLCGLEIH